MKNHFLSRSEESLSDLQGYSQGQIYCKPFQIWFFVQLFSSWQNFNWYTVWCGPSAIAELVAIIRNCVELLTSFICNMYVRVYPYLAHHACSITITHAGCIAAGVGRAFSRVCLSVCPRCKRKRLELWTPNLVQIHSIVVARHALTQRSKGQRSRSHGYENHHGGTVASDACCYNCVLRLPAWVCMTIRLPMFSSSFCNSRCIVYWWNNVCVCSSKPDDVGGQILRHHVKTPRAEELLLIDRETVRALVH